jgi:hypothetical protein
LLLLLKRSDLLLNIVSKLVFLNLGSSGLNISPYPLQLLSKVTFEFNEKAFDFIDQYR